MFNEYPYTDYHELNLDWILKRINELSLTIDTFVNVNTIKYADPITWNITTQYEQNTLVQDSTGTTYLSKKAVPVGITLENTEFWLKVADFSSEAGQIRKSIAVYNDGSSTTALEYLNINDLVWLSGDLYHAIRSINIGDSYVKDGENPNIELVTVEDLIKAVNNSISSLSDALDDEISDRESADTTLQNNIDAEEFARIAADTTLQNNIDAEEFARIAADTELQNNIDVEESARIAAVSAEESARAAAVSAEASARAAADSSEASARASADSSEASARASADNALNTRLSLLDKKRYVFLGDSYNFQGTGWLDDIVESLNIDDDDYFDYVFTAHGFYGGGDRTAQWITDITKFVTENPNDVDTITDIIIIGGINDATDDAIADLGTYVQNFFTYVKSNIPNATVSMCFVGNARSDSSVLEGRTSKNRETCMFMEREIFGRNGGRYLSGTEFILDQYTLFSSDGLHPNQYGVDAIIRGCIQALLTGHCNKYSQFYKEQRAKYLQTEYINAGIYKLILNQVSITAGTVISTAGGGTVIVDVANNTNISARNLPEVLTKLEIRTSSGNDVKDIRVRLENGKLIAEPAFAATTGSYPTITANGVYNLIPILEFPEINVQMML